MDNARSLCPYCGVGCGLEILAGGTKICGDRSHPSSQGMVFVEGATLLETLDHNRATVPLSRSSLREDFQPISWNQALDLIVERIRQSRPERIAIYGLGQLQVALVSSPVIPTALPNRRMPTIPMSSLQDASMAIGTPKPVLAM